jgi:class 3 adenylate cyclase
MSGPSVETGRPGLAFVVMCRQPEGRELSETRKLAAILVADVVGYSRLAGADEDPLRAFEAFAATSSIQPSPLTT